MGRIAPYGKAVTAALVAGLGAAATALSDGTISAQEGVNIAVAFLVALGAVWAIPNGTTPPAEYDGKHEAPPGR